jgi:hypothetical protein
MQVANMIVMVFNAFFVFIPIVMYLTLVQAAM